VIENAECHAFAACPACLHACLRYDETRAARISQFFAMHGQTKEIKQHYLKLWNSISHN